MRVNLIAGMVLASAASAALAQQSDPVHAMVQAFLNEVWAGTDFTQPPYQGFVSLEDAAVLKSFKDCNLRNVIRTEGDKAVFVNFKCEGVSEEETRTVMILVSDDKKVVGITTATHLDLPGKK